MNKLYFSLIFRAESMSKKTLLLIPFVTLSIVAFSQSKYNPLAPPNTFQNKDNPHYWKNRKSLNDIGYWQQDVHYTIKADVDENTDIITGTEQLIYSNNSPHELPHVFFHLYQNAFQPESYYHNLQAANKVKPRYGSYEKEKKGTEILSLTANGKGVKTELDNTILKVILPQPLKPGESITFDISFKTYFDGKGGVRRRMKTFNSWGYKHYDGVHWYPRISVYDAKFGWTTDQHLGREFYGDFGTFDVDLTFANNMVVDATGFLQNREEVLPPDLRKKLDIKNFADKPWNSSPSVITAYQSEQRKTWKFHAENVHDFAFTADPTYRIGEAEWNGIKCISLAQEPHASKWQNAADYTAKIIKVYSEDIGMYTYHKMIVADARDGMEYPMLTLDGGSDPGYRGLLAHEVGHNWFFGQVGNNETYRAPLDEGFTQFLTAWALRAIDGDTIQRDTPKDFYKKKFSKPNMAVYRTAYNAYMQDALVYNDPALNTHSDGFHGALRHGGGYRHVYYKTATMLFNLQYVLGDELFLNAMKHYFQKWHIAHPYFDDFRKAIVEYTKVDLNWFFDQWLETTKRIDYSIKSIKQGKGEDEYIIRFKRKGRMHMPLDFQVTANDGRKYNYYIPNTWFEKETTANKLPRWIGWDKLNPNYLASVNIPTGILDVQIDTSARLADINKLNNNSRIPVKVEFDHRIRNMSDNNKYEVYMRPDIWYNAYDGFKLGLHMNGNYMRSLHKFDFNLWYNTGFAQQGNYGIYGAGSDSTAYSEQSAFDQLSWRLNYSTRMDNFIRGSKVTIHGQNLDGLHRYQLRFEKSSLSNKTNVYGFLKVMHRPDSTDLNYLLYENEWDAGSFNNSINIGLDHNYSHRKGWGSINLHLRSATVGTSYDYSYLRFTAVNSTRISRLVLKTRVFGQLGWGSNWAPESQLFLAGANPEELMDSKYTRSGGFIDGTFTTYGDNINHFHMGGGMNLRGYAGYLAPFLLESGEIRNTYKGTSGASFNMELEFTRFIRWNPRALRNTFDLVGYLFTDGGWMSYNTPDEDFALADFRMDAGVGLALTIKKWGPLQMTQPLTLRFDVPFFVNKLPAVAPNDSYFDWRWMFGISRAF